MAQSLAPTFTAGQFRYVSAIIRRIANERERRKTAELFADYLAFTNPRFDRGRFLKACEEA